VLGIAGIVMLAISPAVWPQEFDYASYTPTTFQDIIAEEENHDKNQPEAKNLPEYIQIECQLNKYRVCCSYANIRRLISGKKKELIRMWMEALKIDPIHLSLYQQEILVSEGTRNHWIPIQEQLFPHIDRELVKNDTISLFIILAGKAESGLVFIATEFDKPVSPDGNSVQATASTRTAY